MIIKIITVNIRNDQLVESISKSQKLLRERLQVPVGRLNFRVKDEHGYKPDINLTDKARSYNS